jgi:glycosyltransferase involved in cell wall biosynthesis
LSGSKRVLTTANHLGAIGGTEVAQLATFRGLAECGWEIELLYVTPGDLWEEWSRITSSATRVRATLPSRSEPVATTIGMLHTAVAGIRTRPDVIYVHNAGDVPVGLGVSAVSRAPVVAHLHLPPPSRQPDWLNALIHRTAAIVTPSSDTARRWEEAAGVRHANSHVIPVGIDIEKFVPLGEDNRKLVRAEIGTGEGELLVFYAGRLERLKGAHFLLDALTSISYPLHVALCGAFSDDDYRSELYRLARGHHVSFLGRRSDMPRLMGAADLVVVPSNWLETQGLVISEAMACGTPVVATAIGGFPTTMRGFPDQMVLPADPAGLAEAIERCVNWRSADPGLGDRSRAWVVENLTLEKSIAKVDELLTGQLR